MSLEVSVVPQHVAEGLGAAIRPSATRLRMYDGSETACNVAELSVEFLRYRFSGPFVLLDADHGVVGRNILNWLVVRLDGPRQVWSA